MMSLAYVTRRPFVRLASAALAATVAVPASADVISGTSNAYTASASLSAQVIGVPPISVNTGGLGLAAGVAPPAYSTSNTLATLNVNAPGFSFSPAPGTSVNVSPLTITGATGISQASSTVNGSPGSQSTAASNTLADVSLNLLAYNTTFLNFPIASGSLLSVVATGITTTAAVSGDYGSLAASGSVYVDYLDVKFAGTSLLTLTSQFITPSTLFSFDLATSAVGPFNTGTISLKLAEMIANTTAGTASMETNFLHLSLSNVGVAVLGNPLASVNAEIIVGHAYASQNAVNGAVPEPASLAMAGLAVAAGGLFHLRRRKTAGA